MTLNQMGTKPMEKALIRVTLLEAFRRFRDSEVIYTDGDGFEVCASEEDVISNVTGEFKGSEYTRIGSAFHSIVETGSPKCVKLKAEKKKVMYRNKEVEVDIPEGKGV